MGKYFSIAEFVKSDTADRKGINNRIPHEFVPHVENLIDKVLDPLREWHGKPIYVNSGYRCPELNRAVGGVGNSYHLLGCAADLDTRLGKSENQKLFEYIKEHLPYTELGWEGNGAWIHGRTNHYRLRTDSAILQNESDFHL